MHGCPFTYKWSKNWEMGSILVLKGGIATNYNGMGRSISLPLCQKIDWNIGVLGWKKVYKITTPLAPAPILLLQYRGGWAHVCQIIN